MPAIVKLTPVLSASLGAIVSYYCLFPLYRAGLISAGFFFIPLYISAAVMCFFRVLASFSRFNFNLIFPDKPKYNRSFRNISFLVTAFTIGMLLGIGSGSIVSQKISFGIPENTVRGISGVLLDDPRIIASGSVMSTISLKNAMGSGGVRTSAYGEIAVFFPDESAGRLKEFGRGTEVFAEGILRKRDSGNFGGDSYTFSADSLHITKTAPALESFRTGLRLSLTNRFIGSTAEKSAWGGLALALLLGIRDNLDAGFSALYRNAGCSYLLALSGMHLAVLIAIISFFLKKPLGLKASALGGSFIIIAYCFLTGPFPSLTRSLLMYLLGVLAVLGMLKKILFSFYAWLFYCSWYLRPKLVYLFHLCCLTLRFQEY